jgi:GNAT superfamily N-acetyltransferase
MTRVNVRVRPAERADVEGMVALLQQVDTASGTFSGRPLLDPSTEHLATRLREILEEGERTLIVGADESGDIVGLLVARDDAVGAIDLMPVLHVTHLLVAPKQRRRGLGRALLAAAVHLAEERGVDRMMATAASGSREGNRYLARLGFAPLVVHRVASVSVLRRSLGMSDGPERMAMLRRARMVRAQRVGLPNRVARRGA